MSLFAYDDDMAPPVGDAAPAPATDARSTARAAREAAYLGGRVDSRDIAYRRAYEPIVEALNAPLRRAGGLTLVSPDAGQFIVNPYRYGRPLDPVAEARGGTAPDEDRLWAEIARRRKTNPGFLPGVPQTQAEFRRQVDARTAEELREAEDIASRGPLWARLLGGVVGGASDPVNIASLPLGAGSAKTVLGTAIREGLTNAGVELLMTPAIAARRAELGQDTSAGDVALNVGAAFTLGGMLGGGIEGVSRWLGGAVVDVGDTVLAESVAQALARPVDQDLTRLLADDRAALAAFDTVIAEPTTEQAAARTVLAEKVETDALSPFVETPAGDAAHYERLGAALDALQNDRAMPLFGDAGVPLARDLRVSIENIQLLRRSMDMADALAGAVPTSARDLLSAFEKVADQPLGTNVRSAPADFVAAMGRLRSGAEGRPASLGDFIAGLGGIRTLTPGGAPTPDAAGLRMVGLEDGDLAAGKGGVTLEAALDAARREGFFGPSDNVTPEALLDLLRRDRSGDRRYRPDDQPAVARDEALRRELDAAGIGLNDDDGRIFTRLEQARAGPTVDPDIPDVAFSHRELAAIGDMASQVLRRDIGGPYSVGGIHAPGIIDDALVEFATPAGPAQQLQADLVQHELEAVLAAPDVPREQAFAAAGFALDLTADGVALRGFDDIMAELDADAAAVRALRECLL